jgi:hypothetical protein
MNMMQKVLTSVLAVVLMLCMIVSANAASTVIFQDGLNGYAGTRDGYIAGGTSGDYSRGARATAEFSGIPGVGGRNSPGFIAFDNIFGTNANQFDPSENIIIAKLKLYVSAVYPNGSDLARVFPMLTPWSEGTSTNWALVDGASTMNHRYYCSSGNYAAGDFWGTGGQITTGPVMDVDYDPALESNAAFVPAGQWIEFDVTAAVEAWKNGTIANNGFYGYTDDGLAGIVWNSSENATQSLRPILEIEYRPISCGDPGVPYPAGDISGPNGEPDCYVNFYDVEILAQQWVSCTMPGGTG